METPLTQLQLGGSLPVPVVQELAKETLPMVPPRYVRSNQHQQIILSALSSLPQIPVIDMQKLSDKYSMNSELQALHNACQEWGFFQLINHGVNFATVEKMKLELHEFFNLPMEEKKKFKQHEGDLQGYGQAFVVSEEQNLDWGDMFFVGTLPTHLRRPHLLPKLPPTFRDAIDEYGSELKTLAMRILKLMTKALDMKAEEMETLFAEGMQSIRMNYYPPCPRPELVTGISPHSDAVALTILLQANETEGLQIKKDGVWIPVSPLPNAFVINIGDILEIVTNGVYRSIEHKVTVNCTKERLSIATFLSPSLDSEVGPTASLVTPQTPTKFKTIKMTEYLKGVISRQLDGKSYLDVMKI